MFLMSLMIQGKACYIEQCERSCSGIDYFFFRVEVSPMEVFFPGQLPRCRQTNCRHHSYLCSQPPGFNAHVISCSFIKHSRRSYGQATHATKPPVYSLFSVLKSLRATSRRLVMVFSPSRTQTRGSKYFLLGLSAPSGLPTVVRR